jgi:hypothetical protein
MNEEIEFQLPRFFFFLRVNKIFIFGEKNISKYFGKAVSE